MIILPLLLTWLLAAHTSAATLTPTLDLIKNPTASDKSLADLGAQSNISAVEGDPWWYCTKVDRWTLPKLEPHDCEGVLDYFYIQTMDEGGTKRLEFLAPGAKGKTHIQVQRTPRKYIFGSVYPCPNFPASENHPFVHLPNRSEFHQCCGLILSDVSGCS